MIENNRNEKRMLAECAEEGFSLLEAHFRNNTAETFMPAAFAPQPKGLASALEGCLYSNNLDVFYASLSLMHATSDERVVSYAISRKDVKADLQRTLDTMEALLYRESPFERELATNILHHSRRSDDEIRQEFLARFAIHPIDMMTLPTDHSIYFAKVNHGYWEYMRSAYDDVRAEREQFRAIDVASKIRRLRTSGVTQLWGRQIHRQLIAAATPVADNHVSLSVSLSAGTEHPSISIRRELNEVTRGAAIGLMSMFETASPQTERYQLGDGGATRDLIANKTLEPFFDKYVADSDVCVFVVPPHLKQVGFVNYSGRIYKFLVPPTRINETWKTVAATLLGYLVRLSNQHRSITLLGQGASIASLMSLIFADVNALKGVRLRYFDLGRVLDVAVPDFLERQAWAKKNLDAYVTEGRKVFVNNVEPDCILASKI